MDKQTQERLDHLRDQIRAERISMSELIELEDMRDEVLEDGDITLAEWAGISEDDYNKYHESAAELAEQERER